MKFLIDSALSPVVAEGLRSAGHGAVHTRDYGLESAPDEDIFKRAAFEARIIVSADTDFGTLLARRQESQPSVILFRQDTQRDPRVMLALLISNLPSIESALVDGSVVVFARAKIRIRSLPIMAKQLED